MSVNADFRLDCQSQDAVTSTNVDLGRPIRAVVLV